jgi:hypothetical protein
MADLHLGKCFAFFERTVAAHRNRGPNAVQEVPHEMSGCANNVAELISTDGILKKFLR